MHENIERNTLDLRYQGYRLRDHDREARLLGYSLGNDGQIGHREAADGVPQRHCARVCILRPGYETPIFSGFLEVTYPHALSTR